MAKDDTESNQLNLTVVALVALVAIVGLVALVMNVAKTQKITTGGVLVSADDQNVAGQSYVNDCGRQALGLYNDCRRHGSQSTCLKYKDGFFGLCLAAS